MILIPRRNKYSKDHPSWQQKVNRRLKLLKFAGMSFWKPEDFALVGPLPPELQFTSVGVFPYGTIAAAAGGDQGTLALTALSSNNSDDIAASSGCRFLTDGDIQEIISGAWTDQNSSTEWIDSFGGGESSSDYEAKFDRTSGDVESFSGFSAENTYTTISTTLSWQLNQIGDGTKSSSGNAYVREISNTSNNASASYSLIASVFGDGCPLCCFTPDTLITMANGELAPICEVEVGDTVRTRDGIEQVTEIITRVQRPMFMVEFDSGHSLHMSEDHPIFVHGKGYSSINPTVPYKDLGVPDVLEIGDEVESLEGVVTVTSIEPAEYLHTVYTLGNSQFFAGGILVY